jgi:uncharacterized lipoprotein
MYTKRLIAILITVGLIILTGGCQTGKQPTTNTYSDDSELSESDTQVPEIPGGQRVNIIMPRF